MQARLSIGLLLLSSSAALAHTDEKDMLHHSKEDSHYIDDQMKSEYQQLLYDKEVKLQVEHTSEGVKLSLTTANPKKAKQLQALAAQVKMLHTRLQDQSKASPKQKQASR